MNGKMVEGAKLRSSFCELPSGWRLGTREMEGPSPPELFASFLPTAGPTSPSFLSELRDAACRLADVAQAQTFWIGGEKGPVLAPTGPPQLSLHALPL